MASRALDAQLASLLTRELGLPVQLAPIKARILRLQASTPKLIMGDPANPAIVATDVVVSLAWADLLNREIRLVKASANDLTVQLSNWPSSDGPWPDDYRFLDQWLPKDLQFETGQYIAQDGSAYPLRDFRWQRNFGGSADIAWKEDRAAGEITLDATLESLQDLLQLSPVELDIAIEATDRADSKIALHARIQPAKPSGYTMDIAVTATELAAKITASHDTTWRLPDHSEIKIGLLLPEKLLSLVKSYSAAGETSDPETLLKSALPALSLPVHQGHVDIDEIRIDDESLTQSAFDFTTSEHGLKISSLNSLGPRGALQGQFDIVSSDSGWQLGLSADLKAREVTESIAAQYLNADWLWHTGHTRLHGTGSTWGELLNAVQGDITLAGLHKGEVETPVELAAKLDNSATAFRLDPMTIRLGDGRITGSAALSGTVQRKLVLDISGEQLDLEFLFTDPQGGLVPGIGIPEYLDFLPGVEIDTTLLVKDLRGPGVNLSRAVIRLRRESGKGVMTIAAAGKTNGTLDLRLEGNSPPGELDELIITAKIDELDIPELFQETVLFKSRSTGVISFQGRGEGMKEVFSSMQGKAQLAVNYRRDNNWNRASSNNEKLRFSGNAVLEIQGDRILGLQVSQLDIESIKQDITGNVSIVDGRKPWLITELESDNLNIDGILDAMPKSTAQADEAGLMSSIRQLGSTKLSLNAKSLIIMDQSLSNMQLEVSSPEEALIIDKLDFSANDSQLKSSGEIRWKGDNAVFKASVDVSNFDLDRFLIEDPSLAHVPVSGTLRLDSEGRHISELLSHLNGRVSLHATRPQQGSELKYRRKLEMQVKRLPNGVHADISKLELAENELSGSLRYHRTSPPKMEIEIKGGSLSLLPWEESLAKKPGKKARPATGKRNVSQAAKKSSDFVGDMLSAPLRFFSGPNEAEPGKKYFSADTLPFNILKKADVKIQGQVDSLKSTQAVIKALKLAGTIKGGKLTAQASAGSLNGGSGEIDLTIDASKQVPAVHLETTFDNIAGTSDRHSFPRSGVASLTSRGQSPAQLAAHVDGTIYLELGRGSFDFRRLALLNADVATTMFSTLIPGIERQEPEIECGVSLATFKDGKGYTPYGFTARTDSANLLGRIEVDLQNEMLQLEFDSRSRHGVGISVGSVFSNSVQIRGPITDPRIVPDTASILWRGWAAFMTVGLSVVGESVFKRALASNDPCIAITKEIRKDFCGTDLPAASSPMICPKR